MITLTIRVGHLSKIIILCLLIAIPANVFALENSVNSTILTENSQKYVSVSLTRNGTETSPLITVQPLILETSAIPPAPSGKPNSSNLTLKNSQLQGLVNDNNHDFIMDSRTGQKYVKDRVIVRFKSQKNAGLSISQEKIRMAHANVGAKVEEDLSTGSVVGLQLVQLPNGTDVQSAIRAYESNPDVLYAEPDYILSILPDQTRSIINDVNFANIYSIPNDPYFADNQWNFHNTGQTGGITGADIDAPGAWNISTGSDSVVVAVIDTGVNYTHSDLSSNIWNNKGEIPGNGVDDDHNGYIDDIRGWNFITNTSDPMDDNGHGTHVSGIIGAVGNNANGVAGVNWHVKIMPLKVFNPEGVGDTIDAINAIEYANVNGASVISNSWGGPDYSLALNDAIDASPAVVVCAAGNNAPYNNDINATYPASFTSANIISVAATDQYDQLASFSHYGPISVDLAAPGKDIWSTNRDGNYILKSGTSMATPHVSGVAALVKSVNQSLTAVQIKNIILSTVDVKSSLTGNVSTGGRLNAYRAVAATPPVPQSETGVYRPGAGFYLKMDNGSTWNPSTDQYLAWDNAAGDRPIAGDWNMDGRDETGVFRPGVGFYLKMDNGSTWNPSTDVYLAWDNAAGDRPIAGDWNKDGRAETGVYRPGVGFYLKMDNGSTWNPSTDVYLSWDNANGDLPMAGNFV